MFPQRLLKRKASFRTFVVPQANNRPYNHNDNNDQYLRLRAIELRDSLRSPLLHPSRLKESISMHWSLVQDVAIIQQDEQLVLNIVCVQDKNKVDHVALDTSIENVAHTLNALNLGQYVIQTINVWTQFMDVHETEGDVVPLSISEKRFVEFYIPPDTTF